MKQVVDDESVPCPCEEKEMQGPDDGLRPYHYSSIPRWMIYTYEECRDYQNCEKLHSWFRRVPEGS